MSETTVGVGNTEKDVKGNIHDLETQEFDDDTTTDTKYVNITVVDSVTEVKVRVARNSNLNNVIRHYCAKRGVSKTGLRFLFNQKQINNCTPNMLEMEAEEVVDVESQMTGGANFLSQG